MACTIKCSNLKFDISVHKWNEKRNFFNLVHGEAIKLTGLAKTDI